MQFFALTVGFFAALSAAQNAFTNPVASTVFTAGESATLTWDPTTNGTVSMQLQWGQKTVATDGVTIAAGIQNTGSYTWDVPSAIPVEDNYFIAIFETDDTNVINYSARFVIDGATGSTTTTSSSASSTASSTSSTSMSSSSTSSSSSSTTSSSSTSSSSTLMTSSSSAVASATSTMASSTSSKASSTSSTASSSTTIANNGVAPTKAPTVAIMGVAAIGALAMF